MKAGVTKKLMYDSFNFFQDRRNRKSRTASMEIESMKEISASADTENRVGDPESHLLHITHE